MIVFALDPGNIESGWCLAVTDESNNIVGVLDKGKTENNELLGLKPWFSADVVVIEMIASYGMAVGKEVFDTCVWIGRFAQAVGKPAEYVYRKDEKMAICHSMKANDTNIRQALVDRYAPGEPNYGKGTKKRPGFFYGFSADAWSAFAVAVTWCDMRNEAVGGEKRK